MGGEGELGRRDLRGYEPQIVAQDPGDALRSGDEGPSAIEVLG